jgi:thiamine kinase-like enzyme
VRSPRYLGCGTWEGARYFVQEGKPGTAIDANQRGLPEVQRRAYELISDFHLQQKFELRVNNQNYTDVFGWIPGVGLEKYSGIRTICESLRRLEAAIQDRLLGKIVSLAWMHGDFKIENMLIDPVTRKIEGVIDWEHARETGLPSIDIWYLITYNRHLVEHLSILDAFTELCLKGNTSREERRMIDVHNRTFNYDQAMEKIMKSAFILHHVCCRMSYDFTEDVFRQRVESLIDDTLQFLEKD